MLSVDNIEMPLALSAQTLHTRRIELRMIVYNINMRIQQLEADLAKTKDDLGASLGALQEIEHWLAKLEADPINDVNLGMVTSNPTITVQKAA